MNPSFSKALELNGMSSSTAIVVWIMIIFLIVLLLGIALLFKKLMANKYANGTKFTENKENETGKGFS